RDRLRHGLAFTHRQPHRLGVRPGAGIAASTRRYAGISRRGNDQGYAGIFAESTRGDDGEHSSN
ncbi:MAG: hypothetical protein ACLP75_10525, partial [Mycobacterium sp.]|uniref:hypothetical protein n=1 Tax=Mycobacterium sp. TaxID=1785 RepID=UPI003F97F32D